MSAPFTMTQKHWIWLVAAAIVSMAVAFAIGGFTAYILVQGIEAALAGFALLAYAIRFRRHDPRVPPWPPLLPLAAVALTGAAKNLYVAWTPESMPVPWWLAALLLGSVAWFGISSLLLLKRRS